MGESAGVTELVRLCRLVIALYEDPHPGLFTWCEAWRDTHIALRDNLTGAYPAEATAEMTTDGE